MGDEEKLIDKLVEEIKLWINVDEQDNFDISEPKLDLTKE